LDVAANDTSSEVFPGRDEPAAAPPSEGGAVGHLDGATVGRHLGEWQAHELGVAETFFECRGVCRAQLEDLYQQTTLALLDRPYLTQEHLRNALRRGIKHRALRLHRDETLHSRINERHARESEIMSSSSEERSVEALILGREDRRIVAEFLAELDRDERFVFWLMAEGMGYRAISIASRSRRPEGQQGARHLSFSEARKLVRSCQRKRELWQELYSTGRLCGYRAAAIRALINGTATSQELASRAVAHIDYCPHCRAEYGTSASNLRQTFKRQAAALIAPTFLSRAGWLTRLALRGRLLHTGVGHLAELRERASVLIANGAGAGQLTRGLAAATVLAAGAIGATHALKQPAHPPSQATRHPTQPIPTAGRLALPPIHRAPAAPAIPPRMPGRVVARSRRHPTRLLERRNEPGGFAYLGIPAATPKRAATPAPPEQQGGGPFGP
jgi:hypothetical protein